MALSHAILVSLLDRPQTGYEIGKRFEKTVGFFWRASHQQIYQQLHKMAKTGWVSSETVEQSDRPNRIVYQITDMGREIVDGWVATPTDPPSVKEELLVKLFAMGEIEQQPLSSEVQRRQAFHQDRLAWYQSIMDEHYPNPKSLSERQKGRYLGLRMGILFEEASLKWSDEAVAMMSEAGSLPSQD